MEEVRKIRECGSLAPLTQTLINQLINNVWTSLLRFIRPTSKPTCKARVAPLQSETPGTATPVQHLNLGQTWDTHSSLLVPVVVAGFTWFVRHETSSNAQFFTIISRNCCPPLRLRLLAWEKKIYSTLRLRLFSASTVNLIYLQRTKVLACELSWQSSNQHSEAQPFTTCLSPPHSLHPRPFSLK